MVMMMLMMMGIARVDSEDGVEGEGGVEGEDGVQM